MSKLIYKEFKLAIHPTVYIFTLFAFMLLIPSYPYYVAFFYTCLGIFFIFMTGRETNDVLFTTLLPVKKSDTVKARLMMVMCIELFQIVISVPFALLRAKLTAEPNVAGTEANVAFFGIVFVMYGLFNLVFFSIFYKTAYRAGIAFIVSTTVMFVYAVSVEIAVAVIPTLRAYIDTVDPAMQVKQLPVLAGGIVIFALLSLIADKKASANFEKVDI